MAIKKIDLSGLSRFLENCKKLFVWKNGTGANSVQMPTASANGDDSAAEGNGTNTYGSSSHAEGYYTSANGNFSHAEGRITKTFGNSSHAEGYNTYANGNNSHAEGYNTYASGDNSHAEGYNTHANAYNSHAEGSSTHANADNSHAEGVHTQTSNYGEHAEGTYNITNSDGYGETIHSVGIGTSDKNRQNAFEILNDGRVYVYGVGGYDGTQIYEEGGEIKTLQDVIGGGSASESPWEYENESLGSESGARIKHSACHATGALSVAEGYNTTASGIASHAEGFVHEDIRSEHCGAKGEASHVEGCGTIANNDYEHAAGIYNMSHTGSTSGYMTQFSIGCGSANEDYSLNRRNSFEIMRNGDVYVKGIGGYSGTSITGNVQTLQEVINNSATPIFVRGDGINSALLNGNNGSAIGDYSVSVGNYTIASGSSSHAEGSSARAIGENSHAEGSSTIASGYSSHAEGIYAEAQGNCSHAEGRETYAIGNVSHSEGYFTVASGHGSHSEGVSTVAFNDYEHAEGYLNVSNSGITDAEKTRHSVGIGHTTIDEETGETIYLQKNAFEIMQNGDVYVYGIGGYSGTTIGGNIKTLQDTIGDVESLLAAL